MPTINAAYFLGAKQLYNFNNNKWYLAVEMIGYKGLINTYSVDDLAVFKSDASIGATPETYDMGCIVCYKLNSNKVITSFSNEFGKPTDMAVTFDTANGNQDGFYYVTMDGIHGMLLSFYPNGVADELDKSTNKLSDTTKTLTLDKDYNVVSLNKGAFDPSGKIEAV